MIIGLTGKSCAGKDEVASILSSFGYYVIDEDKLGHEALRANRDSLISEFGEGILSDGEVDRKKLGSIVFSDPMKLKKLEAISHPWMINETKRLAREAEKKGLFVVINAAILVRLSLDKISDAIQKDIDEFLKEKNYELKNEVSVKSDYFPGSGMEFTVRCQVIENNQPLIDLTLTVPSEAEAETISNNWSRKNQEIYALIMQNLL